MNEDLVNISDLNQYLYCPRRLYYLMFYQTQGMNRYLMDGRLQHMRSGRRGGWIREQYLRSDRLHLHGRVDLIERGESVIPVERKRGDRFFENDEVQLTAYALLLEESIGTPIETGIIYLFQTNRRQEVDITPQLREKVQETVAAIRSMDGSILPPFSDNPRKCQKCSAVGYCMPYESELLESAL